MGSSSMHIDDHSVFYTIDSIIISLLKASMISGGGEGSSGIEI